MKIFANILALTVLLALSGCGDKPAAPTEGSAGHNTGVAPEGQAAHHENGEGPAGRVEITVAAQKEGGINTETLKRASVAETFQAMGRVMQDAQKPHHVAAGCAGRVTSVTALGTSVNPSDILAVVKNAAGEGTPVIAAHKGIVTAVHAAEGDQVNEMTFLLTLTGIDPLWGVLDVPERGLEQARPGQKVEIKTAAYPLRTFKGKIVFISPEIDTVSRTVKARVEIENPEGLLKFGMFIDASVRTGAYFQGVAVRADAVQSGPAGAFVFVKTGGTAFVMKPVVTGREKDGLVEIKEGLEPGDKVAVEGAYLLKSEMMKGLMGED